MEVEAFFGLVSLDTLTYAPFGKRGKLLGTSINLSEEALFSTIVISYYLFIKAFETNYRFFYREFFYYQLFPL
jgi:hypothetical protein